jgi:hypothetical protein
VKQRVSWREAMAQIGAVAPMKKKYLFKQSRSHLYPWKFVRLEKKLMDEQTVL